MDVMPLPFSGKLRSFPNTAARAVFLLGGIGTGNVSVGARGELRDWEIFNGPNKGMKLPCAFFAIHVRQPGKNPVSRVLEARLNPPFDAVTGPGSEEVAGLPRFSRSELTGEYPFVRVVLSDPELPLNVRLEAFTPFIPLNAADSGIPGAVGRIGPGRIVRIPQKPLDFAGCRVNIERQSGGRGMCAGAAVLNKLR